MAGQYCKIVVPVAFLLLGVLAILLLTIQIEDIEEPPDYMYGIVLDAGSSHTAMYIYKWPADKQNGTGIVTQHSECHVKGGGISSYAGQQGAAGRSLETCLDTAVKDIPKSRHSLTPVYLGATAGMRLLTISSPRVSEEILREVGDKIKSYPFNFRGAAILSGQEEGAYGWVTVNYLLENFVKYGFVGHWMSSGRETVGALDFGGASTQITFLTRDPVEDEKDSMTLRLYGKDYALYTHSFLCYGQDQMLRRLLAHLLQSQGYPKTVTHPCFPVGHSVPTEMGKVFDSPCTVDSKPAPYDPRTPVTVLGSGQYHQCLGNVSELFSFGSCSYSQCSFDQVFQPNVSGNFMAFAAFFYVHSFLKLTTGIAVSTPAQLEEAARAVCNLTFQEMLALAPEQEKRLQQYCPAAVFIQVLLLRGYKFDEISLPKVSFQSKAGGASVGWALGYMLSLSNLLPAESVGMRKALHPSAWGVLLFLCSLLLLGALGYLVLHTSRGKNQDGSFD
ncbi:ectonucleoside triphosphate diphosphohydrolase 2-like isoform X1 [Anguilla rostrata]|uniref:ectonucleoside triphosphate diphosphohydrolase 2-like isoform X1 n=2 Tax=Anguilla rostrata TaxID=7938 RepID=UPI0030CC2AB7